MLLKRILIGFAGSLLYIVAAHAGSPNVLIFTVDQIGYSDLGCFGGEIDTPHLDRLAREGVRCSRFYTAGTSEGSFASLLSGYYPQQIARGVVPGSPPILPGRRPIWAHLLPHHLSTSDYRSLFAGRWQIDGSPHEAGFATASVVEMTDWQQHRLMVDSVLIEPTSDESWATGNNVTADESIRQLHDHFRNSHEQNFFAVVAFSLSDTESKVAAERQSPHGDQSRLGQRYASGWQWLADRRFERMQSLGFTFDRNTAVDAFDVEEWDSLSPHQQATAAEEMAKEAASIERIDDSVGRIVEALTRAGKLDDTLILFCGLDSLATTATFDESPATHELHAGWRRSRQGPFRSGRDTMFEGDLRVPMIVRWPNCAQRPGTIVDVPMHPIDIVPTLLELANLPSEVDETKATTIEEPLPGESFVATLESNPPDCYRWLWWFDAGQCVMQTGQYKVIFDATSESIELYDLAADECESTNIAIDHLGLVECLGRNWNNRCAMYRWRLENSVQMP